MLAFLGGTGPEGRGLALRLALAGEDVVIGSRDAQRAAAAAEELASLVQGASSCGSFNGYDNLVAAQQADAAFLTVPYEAQRPMLEQLAEALAGKVVVNVIAPMRFERGRGAIAVPVEAGSASEEAQVAAAQLRCRGRLPKRKCRGTSGVCPGYGGRRSNLRRQQGCEGPNYVLDGKDTQSASGGRRRTG